MEVREGWDGSFRPSSHRAAYPDTHSFPSVRFLQAAALVYLVLSLSLLRTAPAAAANSVIQRSILPNGVHVVFYPFPGATRMAVQALYRVGFLDEPCGMTQVTHLLEHLQVRGATRSYAAGQSYATLSKRGLVNAETLESFTHYDYMIPTSDLGRALRIEAERLGSLHITRSLVTAEAARVYSEVAPAHQAGLPKHALMALHQEWSCGAAAARIAGGLESISLAKLEALRQRLYTPSNLTLVIAGDLSFDRVLALARDTVGSLPRRPAMAVPVLLRPGHGAVRWDTDLSAVAVSYPPIKEPLDRIELALWAGMMQQRMAYQSELTASALTVSYPNVLLLDERTPFTVYAVCRPRASPAKLAALLERSLDDAISHPLPPELTDVFKTWAAQTAQLYRMDWKGLQAEVAAASQGGAPALDASLALGNTALQVGAMELSYGPGAEAMLKQIQGMKSEDLETTASRLLRPATRRVDLLIPASDPSTAR